MTKSWKKWSLGFTGILVALGAAKAAGYPVEEVRPALHYELSELAGEFHSDKLVRLKREWYHAKEMETKYKYEKQPVPRWLIDKLIFLETEIKKLERKKN